MASIKARRGHSLPETGLTDSCELWVLGTEFESFVGAASALTIGLLLYTPHPLRKLLQHCFILRRNRTFKNEAESCMWGEGCPEGSGGALSRKCSSFSGGSAEGRNSVEPGATPCKTKVAEDENGSKKTQHHAPQQVLFTASLDQH